MGVGSRTRVIVLTAIAMAVINCAIPMAAPSTASAADLCSPSFTGTPIKNPGTAVPWAQTRLGLNPQGVWSLTQGSGVTVAVVDSGVDDLQTVLPNSVVNQTVNELQDGNGTADCVEHGTQLAGIIAGQPGLGGFEGVAPLATILPVRVTDSAANGDPALLAKGITDAVRSGARVVNVSMTVGQDTPELDQAVAFARSHNALVVAAAGNFGNSEGALYPASISGVLSVGAVNADGTPWQQTEVGGPVDVAAPGADVQVPSAVAPGVLETVEGTSYSAAFVSGVAALILSYHPELTPDQVIQRIETTADRPSAAYLPDPQVGWGVVNPYRAVTAEVASAQAPATPATPKPVVLPAAVPAVPNTAAHGAVLAFIIAGLLALALPATTLTLRRGRERSWRPGMRE